MTKDEALKLGLQVIEAAEYLANNPAIFGEYVQEKRALKRALIQRSKISFEEALAQPKQEPVVCPYCKNSATLGAVYYDQNCLGCVKRMTVSQTPPPCQTCEALARTVMLDQTYYDAQRKPLTDEQIEMIGDDVANEKLVGEVPNFRLRLARAIEAAHGIKGE